MNKIYENAIELGRKLIERNPELTDWVVSKFPELRESEDERTRKEIISFLKEGKPYHRPNSAKMQKWSDWLEKQEKLIDKFMDKLAKYREWLIGKTEQWTKRRNNETNNNADEYYCIGTVNALMSAREEFEETFDYESWPEKKGEDNPYSGTSFDYNGHVWEMFARDGGVDILCDSQLIRHIEKQGGKKPQGRPALEVWKDMRLEVYQQASGNRHEPDCSDDGTKMFSLNDIDEIFEKVAEEQDEQKPTGKVEPKFKAGDWVRAISSGNIFKILSVNDGLYRVLCYDGIEANYPIIDVDYDLAYWTIQDAKDGDVLATKDAVFIFKHIDKVGLSLCKSYCEVIGNSELGFGFDFSINSIYPATKEQRKLLFSKIKDACYEWNSEKKELRKIEQKPAWSEEDEEMAECVLISLEFFENLGKDVTGHPHPNYFKVKNKTYPNSVRNWLKSIKDRVKPQPKQEWSEEDEKYFESSRCYLNEFGNWLSSENEEKSLSVYKTCDWIRSIKDRMKGKQ